jgi:hypothetical protein
MVGALKGKDRKGVGYVGLLWGHPSAESEEVQYLA